MIKNVLLLNMCLSLVLAGLTNSVPFSIKFGGQAWGMAKSVDNGATWEPIATVDMHTYQQVGMVGEVRDYATEGMIIKFQPLNDHLARDLGYQCPVMHEKCDGTCTFDDGRNSCFNWDSSRIFIHELNIDGQKQDFSSLNTMLSSGWNFQCRSLDSSCQPPMTVIDFGEGYMMVRQDGTNFYYTYTFTGIEDVKCYDTPNWSDGANGCESYAELGYCSTRGHKTGANTHCCACGGGRAEPNTDPFAWRGDLSGKCPVGFVQIRTKDECEAAAVFFSESDKSASNWPYPHHLIPSGCWVYLNNLYFNNDPNQWDWSGFNGHIKAFCKREGTAESTAFPTMNPTLSPTFNPTSFPTLNPSLSPTTEPTVGPTVSPTLQPTLEPSMEPTASFTYLGCFIDDSDRDLDALILGYGHNPESCSDACHNYGYFALQNGGWCVCDNTYSTEDKYHQADDSECGSGAGGAWRNAVYQQIHEVPSNVWTSHTKKYCPIVANGGRKQCPDNDLEACKMACEQRADCVGLNYNRHPNSDDYQLYIMTASNCDNLVSNQWLDYWSLSRASVPSNSNVWISHTNQYCPVLANGGRKQCPDNDFEACKMACEQREDCVGLNYNRHPNSDDYQLYIMTASNCDKLVANQWLDYWSLSRSSEDFVGRRLLQRSKNF